MITMNYEIGAYLWEFVKKLITRTFYFLSSPCPQFLVLRAVAVRLNLGQRLLVPVGIYQILNLLATPLPLHQDLP